MENNDCSNCIFKTRCDECYKQLWELFKQQNKEFIADSCHSSESLSVDSEKSNSLHVFIENDDDETISSYILNKPGIGFDEPLGLQPMSSPTRRIKKKKYIKNVESEFDRVKQENYNLKQVKKIKTLRNRIKREREEYARANENDAYLDEILSDIKYFNN